MDLKDAKIVKKYNDEFMDSVKELRGRLEYRRSILNQANFHNLEDTGKKSYFISDTRILNKDEFIKEGKKDLYDEIAESHLALMDEAARLVMANCLNYCVVQGDNDRNELEFDGLIKHLSPTPIKNLDTLIEKYLPKDKPMITFIYGDNGAREMGGVIVSDDDDFSGIDIYGATHKYELSEYLFSIVWHGYVEFSPELINKLTLYTYPIGEDGATV